MSDRHDLADRITRWVEERNLTLNAPVKQELKAREDGPGFARRLTFGVEGSLLLEIMIWKVKRIDVRVNNQDWVNLTSEEQVYEFIERAFRHRSPGRGSNVGRKITQDEMKRLK